KGRIYNDRLAPPQPQDLPNDGADVAHIHPLDDPTWLDLSFESIAQSIELVADSVISNGNFGKSASSFIRGIFFSNEFTQGQCPDRSEHTRPSGSRLSSHVFALCERISAHIAD